MNALHKAVQQALDVLEEIADEVCSPYDNKLGDAILALRAALAQKQAEPLTEEEIWNDDGIMAENKMPMLDLVYLVRAVERAHGITNHQGGAND